MFSPFSLQCHNLAFERDDVPVFSGVSLSVEEGQIVQIVGQNGTGKTTLLRILTTALTPTAGTLFWSGKPLFKHRSEYLQSMLYLGHQPGIKHGLSPRENLSWLLKLHPASIHDIDQTLEAVGLAGYEDTPAQILSAGQLRRVALAQLYITSARLWILDEPFTAIDRSGVTALEELMTAHLAKGGMIVLSTHQQLSIRDVKSLDLQQFTGTAIGTESDHASPI